jgi:hypothetical protein
VKKSNYKNEKFGKVNIIILSIDTLQENEYGIKYLYIQSFPDNVEILNIDSFTYEYMIESSVYFEKPN